jgi:hypothetical protein
MPTQYVWALQCLRRLQIGVKEPKSSWRFLAPFASLDYLRNFSVCQAESQYRNAPETAGYV